MGNDPDAGGYKIERRAEDDSSFVFMPIMDLATSCSDTGLISDRMYHYRVSAYQGDVKEYYDYYPFGKIMPGRSLVSGEQPA
ncbi:MAG: hypothetical protein GF353_08550, partial [Candidatus Lokiarchaeota archaeon]|nr:hypothetical protein [Candidatus Lokiarchaeota archaeon]